MKKLNIKSGGLAFIALFLSLVLFSGCSLFSRHYEKVEKKDISISTVNKKKVVLDNTNGDIKVTKSPSDSVLRIKAEGVFHLTKREMNENTDRIKIKIDSTGDIIKISSDFENVKHVFSFNFHIGSTIDYEIFVPDGLEVSVDNTNGKIELFEINNKVDVNQTNGNIKLTRTTGVISVDNTNGKISGDLDSSKGLNLKTVNGNITLNLGSTFSGKFRMETANGRITKKDFDFREVYDEKKLFRGILGSGDADIKLETTNGRISITKK